MEEIKLGTIGSGVIVRAILDSVKLTEGISLEAVYSRTEEKGRELANVYGAGKVYTDLDAFLSDEEMNFVYVASPNNLHYEQAKSALAHGKNVICEKPLCPREKEAKELAVLAKEKNLFLVDATPTAFLPNLRQIREWLSEIGPVRLVLSSYSQYSSRYDKLLAGEVPNVFSPDFAGGCMQDINYYNLYLNVVLFGMPESAVYYPNICRTGVDTSGIAILRYPGFVSECAAAKDTWGVNSVQIQGEKGYLYIEGGANGLANVRLVTKDAERECNLQEEPDRWRIEIRNMTQMLLKEEREAFEKQLATAVDVIGIMEKMRKDAGILFTGEV